MATQPTPPAAARPPAMPGVAVISLGIYFIVASLVILYLLVVIWPARPSEIPLPSTATTPAEGKASGAMEKSPATSQPNLPTAMPQPAPAQPPSPQPAATSRQEQKKEGVEPAKKEKEEDKGTLRAWAAGLGDEERLLLIVALAGALGAYVHAAQSFVTYVGNRQIVSSWLWWYLLRPFIGLALAEILYLAVRGGFFTMGTDTRAINHFGVAALAGLAGMFSKEATDKLQELFKNLFRTEKDVPRKEKLEDV